MLCHCLPPILRPALHRAEQERPEGTAHRALHKVLHPSTPASHRLVTPRAGTPSATTLPASRRQTCTGRSVCQWPYFNAHDDVAAIDAAASGWLLRSRPTESTAHSSPRHRKSRPAPLVTRCKAGRNSPVNRRRHHTSDLSIHRSLCLSPCMCVCRSTPLLPQ